MKLGTVVQAKYFNGVAPTQEAQIYQQNLSKYFKNVGMFAFGQMPFIAKNGSDPEKDYDWTNIDRLVEWGQQNKVEIQYNTVINSHHNSFPDWYYDLPITERK